MSRRNAPEPTTVQKPERLQKIMAAAGLGSRRALEQRIKDGEVKINGATAGIGQSVAEGDRVGFEGQEWKVVAVRSKHRNLVYNKPTGDRCAASR